MSSRPIARLVLLPFIALVGVRAQPAVTRQWSMKAVPSTASFADNGDGTITDNVTGLMWQKDDGGEMTWEQAPAYAKQFAGGGHHDWRLPTPRELFSILDHGRNPALDPKSFPATGAEYWWSSEPLVNDRNRIWVINAGGGSGPHPRNETISAGGSKRFHTRCVRDTAPARPHPPRRYLTNGDGTATDLATHLVWQQAEASSEMTWADALSYARSLSLGGKTDWRLPSIKELQSINDESRTNPSIDRDAFPDARPVRYWSSTTLFSRDMSRAWFLELRVGITSYDDKAIVHAVKCVRGS